MPESKTLAEINTFATEWAEQAHGIYRAAEKWEQDVSAFSDPEVFRATLGAEKVGANLMEAATAFRRLSIILVSLSKTVDQRRAAMAEGMRKRCRREPTE